MIRAGWFSLEIGIAAGFRGQTIKISKRLIDEELASASGAGNLGQFRVDVVEKAGCETTYLGKAALGDEALADGKEYACGRGGKNK